jgi:hypothetical protein
MAFLMLMDLAWKGNGENGMIYSDELFFASGKLLP